MNATLKRFTIKHYRRTLAAITGAPVLIHEQEIRAFGQPEAVKETMRILEINHETDCVILSQGGQMVWQMGSLNA